MAGLKGKFEIVFEDPPERVNYTIWDERLAPLTKNPTRWARVYEAPSQPSANQMVARINKGDIFGTPEDQGKYEATYRSVPTAKKMKYVVYARWMPTLTKEESNGHSAAAPEGT